MASAVPRGRRSKARLMVGVLGLLVLGVLLAGWMASGAEREFRADQLQQTRMLAQALNLERVKVLTGTPADLVRPEYAQLREQLGAARAVLPNCKFISVVTRRPEGSVVYLVDSEPAGSSTARLPGQVLGAFPEPLRRVFTSRNAAVIAPVTVPRGRLALGMEAVQDGHGRILAGLVTFVDGRAWDRVLIRAALPSAGLTLALIVLLLIGSARMARKARSAGAQPFLEPALVVAAGLLITGFGAWTTHTLQARNRHEAFIQLAVSQTEPMAHKLYDIRDIELESLGHFHADTLDVSPERFRKFTAYLTENPSVSAWEWIPAVAAADRARFEVKARADGQAGYGIWEKDAQGRRVPASGRDVYFPVSRVSPLAGNEKAPGYDLGSEPLRRAALLASQRTGMVIGTDPVTLVQETGSQKGMLIYRPVVRDGRTAGFVLAVLRMGTLMKSGFTGNAALLELSLLRKDAPVEPLATAWDTGRPPVTGLTATRPIFAFGKVFGLTAHAGPEFLQMHPMQAWWVAVLVGLVLTAALAGVTRLALRRHEELEQLVAERTLTLQAEHAAAKQAELDLKATNRELAAATVKASEMAAVADRANAAKSEFLANMSHEIRTPMNGVLGMAELLAGSELTIEQRDYVSAINRSGESLLSLLNDILDFSKIEAGQLTLETVPFDLGRLVFDVAELFRSKLEGRPVELLVDVEPAAHARVLGDPGRLRQVLNNLISNAIKFTETGHILVEVGSVPDEDGARAFHLAVQDTGIGIPPDKQARLFQPFIQADSSTARRYGGTGLGLVLVKRILEAMGGTITLASEEGVGTRLTATLPLRPDAASAEDAAEDGGLAGRRILVVDDLAINRKLLTHQLGTRGVRVEAAASGTEALARLREACERADPFHAAVVDLNLGQDMDGEALGRTLRAEPAFRTLALVVLTATGVRGDPARLARLGFDGYLLKPAPAAILARTLVSAIRHASGPSGEAMITRHSVREGEPSRAAAEGPTLRARILLVEDQEINQIVARKTLERAGATVAVAGNGRIALARLAEESFDLVLMDCQMPEMDGFEATAQIRQTEAGTGRHLPIIAMTAHAMVEDRDRCLASGMDDYLTKPIAREALLRGVALWLAPR